ncbi:DUF4113 domain-containing protein [Pantoea sp. B9002]|nr:DUF4113 domain-containing protein [Pantoea sp. B9002]
MLLALRLSLIRSQATSDENRPRGSSIRLMEVMDGINQSGLGSIWSAARGVDTEWKMKREMLSPHQTTSWSDIPVACVLRR